MKIAFDVDVLAKQMSINDYVHKVADWGYKYIEQSPHPRINPFYKHPLFSKECQQEYKQALKETGVEISSFIVVYRWSGPTEEQRQHAVANWKRMIEIAVDMGVPVINTEFSGDPNQQEICNGMFFKSMEELLPIIEREGIRVECQSHPYDFVELNDEACDIVKSFRSKNLGYVYSASHGFFYDQGKGDVRHMLKYAGDELTHVLLADTWNQTKDCRYIVNPPWLNQRGRADYTIHQHTAMGEGEVDFDGIFETLRDMDFANKQLKPDAPKVGGDNIICVSYFGFPEKMEQQAPEALGRQSFAVFLALTALLGHRGGVLAVAARALDHRAVLTAELGQRMLGAVIELHLADAAQHLGRDDLAAALGGIDNAALTRRDLLELGGGLVLVFQAAHQTAANTGDLRRIERKVLVLGQVDGDRMKVVEVGRAAQLTAAAAEAADHLRLVAHADLAQLDTGAEHAGQILDQLAEVYAAVRSEVEQQLVHVERAFRGHEVHFQTAVLDLSLADEKRLVRALAVALERFHIRLGRDADHALERLHDRLLVHLGVALHALAVFQTARGLDDYAGTGGDFGILRVKIIHFSV